MVRIKQGNILNCDETIICHQCNAFRIYAEAELQDNSPTAMKT